MPRVFSGAPLPLRIVLGIEATVLPAECAEKVEVEVVRIAIVNRTAKRLAFTGHLQVWVLR
jgi:hypothetical protein